MSGKQDRKKEVKKDVNTPWRDETMEDLISGFCYHCLMVKDCKDFSFTVAKVEKIMVGQEENGSE